MSNAATRGEDSRGGMSSLVLYRSGRQQRGRVNEGCGLEGMPYGAIPGGTAAAGRRGSGGFRVGKGVVGQK